MESLNERDQLEHLGIDGKVILKWIINRVFGRGLDIAASGQEQVADWFEDGNEPSGPKKCGEFLD
jgi:hypothetical protein